MSGLPLVTKKSPVHMDKKPCSSGTEVNVAQTTAISGLMIEA